MISDQRKSPKLLVYRDRNTICSTADCTGETTKQLAQADNDSQFKKENEIPLTKIEHLRVEQGTINIELQSQEQNNSIIFLKVTNYGT